MLTPKGLRMGGDRRPSRVRISNVSILIGIVSVDDYNIVIKKDGKL